MLRLIQDLLDIERIAIGKLVLHYEKHDISEIIREVVGDFQRDAASKHITLTAKPGAGCDDALCDRSRVVQVLSNLIGNAIKFTPAKGQICVSCAQTGPERPPGFRSRYRSGHRPGEDRNHLRALLPDQ